MRLQSRRRFSRSCSASSNPRCRARRWPMRRLIPAARACSPRPAPTSPRWAPAHSTIARAPSTTSPRTWAIFAAATKPRAISARAPSLDDPRSANIKMRGVTPPHLYDLKPREALFHGVAALRLNPVGGEASIYGRAGLLAHTFMLGPNGDSNGCVSFRDYNAFLNAYRNKGVRRLAVVAHL